MAGIDDSNVTLERLNKDIDKLSDAARDKLDSGYTRLNGRVGYTPMIITTENQQYLFNKSESGNTEDSPNDPGNTANLGSATVRDRGRHLLFWAGPKTVQWKFQQRGSMQQTRSGHIAHYWKDQARNTYFDNPSIEFTFQTGSLLPLFNNNDLTFQDGSRRLPPGLVDYYDFFGILDEAKVLSSGRPNYVIITYQSLLYPTIVLRGFFEPEVPMIVSEDSAKPASITWNATFRLKDSTPKFNNSQDLAKSWISSLNMNIGNQRLDAQLALEQEAARSNIEYINASVEAQALDDRDALKAEIEANQAKNKWIDYIEPVPGETVGSQIGNAVGQRFASPEFVKDLYKDEFQ